MVPLLGFKMVIATGLTYPLRAAIKGYVEIFGDSNKHSICPIGHVTFRAPELLRYANSGQIVADSGGDRA